MPKRPSSPRKAKRPKSSSKRVAAPRLTVELVPEGQWGANVRAILTQHQWDRVRLRAYADAQYRCQICGGRGKKYPVDCHEVWRYDERARMQTLVRMIALCPACHEVKHFGRASVMGRQSEAMAHLMKVNGWTEKQAGRHVDQAYENWERQSAIEWELDVSALKRYGVEPPSPTIPRRR